MNRNRVTALSICMVTIAFLTIGATGASAWGQWGMNGRHHGNQDCARAMQQKLNLSDEQKVLMDEMHQAFRGFRQKMCPDGWKPECMKNRVQMRARHLFMAEMAADNPDFQAVADKLKAEYNGDYRTEFETAVDAKAAFLASLSPEQRENMLQMRFQRNGNGMHGTGGKPCPMNAPHRQ